MVMLKKINGQNLKICNCEIDDVDENKKNNELSPKKRIRIQDNVRNLKNANLEIGNRYSFKIYDWLFIMNAGSLAGTITFLTIKEKDTDFIILCVAMGVAFFFGILFIPNCSKT